MVTYDVMNIWSNLYRHHRWANLVLIDFLSGLDPDHLSLAVPHLAALSAQAPDGGA